MGFEAPSQPKIDERVEDVGKAQEMAQAGDRDRTAVSGSSKFNDAIIDRPMQGLRGQLDTANEALRELQDDPAKAEAKRGHLDDIHVRAYQAEQLSGELEGREQSADRKEEIAGIVYDLQNSSNISEEDIKQIKSILSKSK